MIMNLISSKIAKHLDVLKLFASIVVAEFGLPNCKQHALSTPFLVAPLRERERTPATKFRVKTTILTRFICLTNICVPATWIH